MKTHHLRITSQEAIPADVLVEHIGYHLRTDFQESGFINVEVTGPRSYSQRLFAPYPPEFHNDQE
jgi:hypothetical protein